MKHLLTAILLLVFGATSVAAAKRTGGAADVKTDPAKMTEDQRKARAQKLVSEGRSLFERKSFDDAIDRFEEAFRLFPKPKMFYNIGLTYEALKKDDRALCALERFVAEAPDADPAFIADSKQKIERMKGSVARVEVQAPEGAIVFIDGDERGAAPFKEPMCVAEGLRRFVAIATGVAPVGVDVDVKTSESIKLSFDPAAGTAKRIGAPEPAPAAPPPQVVAPPPPPPPPATTPVYKQWWLWTAVGVVVVGGTAAGLAVGLSGNVTPPAAEFGPYKVFP